MTSLFELTGFSVVSFRPAAHFACWCSGVGLKSLPCIWARVDPEMRSALFSDVFGRYEWCSVDGLEVSHGRSEQHAPHIGIRRAHGCCVKH